MHAPSDTLTRLWRLAAQLFGAVMAAAACAALAGWRPAAWILPSALAALLATHLGVSAVAYRRTMRREWPKVAPVPDDD